MLQLHSKAQNLSLLRRFSKPRQLQSLSIPGELERCVTLFTPAGDAALDSRASEEEEEEEEAVARFQVVVPLTPPAGRSSNLGLLLGQSGTRSAGKRYRAQRMGTARKKM